LAAIASVLFLFFAAADVAAQSPPNLPKWDTAAVTGVFDGHPSEPPESGSFDRWYHTGTVGLAAGRYLTSMLKLEGEVTFSGEGSRYTLRLVDVPGIGQRPFSAEQLIHSNGISSALVWQFFENQWVHPFLMAGASLDFNRETVHIWQQTFYRGDPRVPGNEVIVPDRVEHAATTRAVRGLVGGGAKLYVTPRAFFRTDTRIGIGSHSSGHVSFRLGFGTDF
jgi:hypothetical protein